MTVTSVKTPSGSSDGQQRTVRNSAATNGALVRIRPKSARVRSRLYQPRPAVALREAIDGIESVGIETIRTRIAELTTRLGDRVPTDWLHSPPPPESGLVTINVDDPSTTLDRLAEAGITVRDLPEPDGIRASVHAVNTTDEGDRFADAIDGGW